ncbi:DNA polymerase kappa [Astathelohania contejeani]|uniref:DNA polymerase kappa n=1 Tax=Astathelohania contejeani TaxID=164912 RepID=A0ABQ7I1P6_9MICR|nr:DNA polymerase kappa [Thelohania contejeani]
MVHSSKIELTKSQPNFLDENLETKFIKIHEKAFTAKSRLYNFSVQDIDAAKNVVCNEIKFIKASWPALFGSTTDKIYVHVDLDSFYASVEMLANPELRHVPLGVGSNLMLATCNYEARKYGVRAGMPGYYARNICPGLVIVKTDFKKYNRASEHVMSILSIYDNKIEIYGMDEACLIYDDIKFEKAWKIYEKNEPAEFNFENVAKLTGFIREEVYKQTGLTISAGISVCRGLAKLASDINKPNGQEIIHGEFEKYLADLNIEKINGIGKYTKEMLFKTLEIKTVKDLRNSLHMIYLAFPKGTFRNLVWLSFGLSHFDKAGVIKQLSANKKSQAADYTFTATDNYSDICNILWNLAGKMEKRLGAIKSRGWVATLKIKFEDFRIISRQKKLKAPIYTQQEIYDECFSLITENIKIYKNKYYFDEKIRLLGIRISELVDEKSLDLIYQFRSSNTAQISRECPVCTAQFFCEPNFIYESHVNNCLNEKNKEEKKQKIGLLKYFKKIVQ